MLRILVSIILALMVVVMGCTATQPPEQIPPPAAPTEVLSVWKSPPSPQSFPPLVSEEFVLERYGDSDSDLATEAFFLRNYQWIDVIVKSKNMPVYFSEEEPGTVCFSVRFEWSPQSSFSPDFEDVGGYPGGEANPFVGKMLYPRPFCQETLTASVTIYTTAVRLFAEGEHKDGNWLGSSCSLYFSNYNVDKRVELSYEIYKLAMTREWGYMDYQQKVLVPWFRSKGISDSSYSSAEADRMWKEWLEQFK